MKFPIYTITQLRMTSPKLWLPFAYDGDEEGIVAGEKFCAEHYHQYKTDWKHAPAQKFLDCRIGFCQFRETVADNKR